MFPKLCMRQLPLRGKRKQVNIRFIVSQISPWALIKSWFAWSSFLPPYFAEYEPSQGPDKKRTVYQMALSKNHLPLHLFYQGSFLTLKRVKRVLPLFPFPWLCFSLFSFWCFSLCVYVCACFSSSSDKLDEILAAAQHTITSDNQGQRGHGGKRDRSKSIVPNVSNEVPSGKLQTTKL